MKTPPSIEQVHPIRAYAFILGSWLLSSTARHRMLPLLISDPSLINTNCEAHKSQQKSNNNANQCCHHDIPCSTLSFKPFFNAAWRWILHFIVQLRKTCSEVIVRNVLFFGSADRGRLKSETVRIEARSRCQ
jgi:hypothetical protein